MGYPTNGGTKLTCLAPVAYGLSLITGRAKRIAGHATSGRVTSNISERQRRAKQRVGCSSEDDRLFRAGQFYTVFPDRPDIRLSGSVKCF